MSDRNTVIGTGFLRPDGQKGIRNRLLVIYTSPYAEFAARSIASAFSPQRMEVIGFGRCADSPFTERKLAAYAAHPNVGGVLVVSNMKRSAARSSPPRRVKSPMRSLQSAAMAASRRASARGSRWRRRCLRS